MGIHIGRTDDAEGVFDALRHQRFDKRLGGGHADLAAGLGGILVV